MSSPAISTLKMMLAKDLVREMRSKEIFLSSFLFSVILMAAFHFASAANRMPIEYIPTTALWVCILFSGTLGLNRTHASELKNGCFRALMLAPKEAGWIYLAKVTSNALLLGFTLCLLVPILVLFFQFNPGSALFPLLLSLILGILGFVAVGTVIVAVTANTRMSDILFPIIQLPLQVPVLIAGTQATQLCLEGKTPTDWWQFLVAINVVYLSIGFLVYEFLLEE
ncbi:MAG: heme exporter protein CcmB [Acidobacteria bacterium]|nr:heme exporter protein CcmB [Acidobacteriota bacterium]MCB9399369.1 heme exporter protein CcmB [Acidobacteriota bacterium]